MAKGLPTTCRIKLPKTSGMLIDLGDIFQPRRASEVLMDPLWEKIGNLLNFTKIIK